MVELLVIFGLLSLCMALLLPAVQAARSAARNAQCKNHLQQIGTALQNYASQHGRFPPSMGLPNPGARQKQFSAFTQLLPYLDQTPLYHSINFDFEMQNPYRLGLHSGEQANLSAMQIRLTSLICPSDTVSKVPFGPTSYRFNLGSERWIPAFENGRWAGPLDASLASITDGLSHTAVCSEKLISPAGHGRIDPGTVLLYGCPGSNRNLETAIRTCRQQDGQSLGFLSINGWSWFVGCPSLTCYNHTLQPNSSMPDCVAPSNPVVGLVGARSNHHSGVNLGLADGSVRSVRHSIESATWRALGTIGGGEVLPVLDD